MKTDNPGPLADLLEALGDISPAEAVERLADSLGRAQDPGSKEAMEGADEGAVAILGSRRAGDALLERVPLPLVAGIADRAAARLAEAGDDPPADLRRHAWDLLDILRRSALLRRIASEGAEDEWAARILRLVEGSHFTFGRLFARRAAQYGTRPLFQVPGPAGMRPVTWQQAAGRVELTARGLVALLGDPQKASLAILSENRLEMAILDLACLSTGIVNVMIPATATDREVAFILKHAKVGTIVVSSREQLAKVLKAREEAPGLRTIVAFDADAATRGVLPFEAILERASETPASVVAEARERVRIGDLATLMYTSGTTGTPKGIMFSQRNIVFKRFARALAIPEIGEGDRFLCYLPLFHTFGRFLELAGCVFWGAVYGFAANPSVETLIRQMQILAPTVFISIPVRWMQIYEAIRQRVDVEGAEDSAIEAAVREVTGGSLRWGLSAAGYLDPEIFRFFQRYGVELMSGFGMTEATGGITMTPPGRYRDDSLGRALPGIEISLAEDGELRVRGPYVMIGYLDPPEGETSFDAEGWLHTGDLMEQDSDGFIRIVDRKKEIYKNIKGQTVAPQKIENLFRDFESVGRIFLVGDGRPYNTALIHPNPEFREIDWSTLRREEIEDHFRSLVVTTNGFLAPFERIVDFAIIDRSFEAEKGELTPKHTYRRKTIERNFADTIRLLYRRSKLGVGGVDVDVPNWLFQALGLTAPDLRVEGDRLTLRSVGGSLTVRRLGEREVQVGSAVYRIDRRSLDLGALLSRPDLWLGNGELVDFAPLEPARRDRGRAGGAGIVRVRREGAYAPSAEDRAAAGPLVAKKDLDLLDLHRAALLLESEEEEDAMLAVRVLEHALSLEDSRIVEAALRILRRATSARSPEVLRRAFQVLALAERPEAYRATLAAYLDASSELLDDETTAVLVERGLTPDRLDAFVCEAEARRKRVPASPRDAAAIAALFQLLAEYGAARPTSFRAMRAFLTRVSMLSATSEVRDLAAAARRRIEEGFRAWLGAPTRIAVDPETGLEYRWDDVVVFAEDVDEEGRKRLLSAFKHTPMLREAGFLFSSGTTIRLEDILPSGVWVRLAGEDHGKSVYRVAVKTRDQEQFDLAVNLNRALAPEEAREEIAWLIICSEDRIRPPLVEAFGGYWPDQDLWTEEFIPGETLDRALRKLARRKGDEEHLVGLWPYAAWSALSAYVDLRDRTGEANPTPNNVIVPMHDYHTGARLVSISSREPFESRLEFLQAMWERFVQAVETEHPALQGLVGWDIVFASVIEVLGVEEGTAFLRGAAAEIADDAGDGMRERLDRFVAAVGRRGFFPKRLYFATKRYRRWAELNPDATLGARAATLQELFETYRLGKLQDEYPEMRVRFFLRTVFRGAPQPLTDGLFDLVQRLRRGEISPDEISSAIADLRAQLQLDPAADYFLARLSYPHLRPEDEVEFVAAQAGGTHQSEMVVTVLDADGNPYRIRHALSPKEVGKLHRLFLAAKLDVQFRPEHRFLVAINDRGSLIGGLFYEVDAHAHAAHMDKIVVGDRFQGKGIGGGVLEELCNRLRTAGVRSLTTGFFRPQFFYRHGFTVEKRYAGLVRSLASEETKGT